MGVFTRNITQDAITRLRAEGSEAALEEAHDLERELEEAEAERSEEYAGEPVPVAQGQALAPPGSPEPQPVEVPEPPTLQDVETHAPDPSAQGVPPVPPEGFQPVEPPPSTGSER